MSVILAKLVFIGALKFGGSVYCHRALARFKAVEASLCFLMETVIHYWH